MKHKKTFAFGIAILAIIVLTVARAGQLDAGFSKSDNRTFEYKTEKAYAERDGNQIYGVMYIPQDAGGQMPTVISASNEPSAVLARAFGECRESQQSRCLQRDC